MLEINDISKFFQWMISWFRIMAQVLEDDISDDYHIRLSKW